jgi:hypothetical protein
MARRVLFWLPGLALVSHGKVRLVKAVKAEAGWAWCVLS